MQTEDRKARDRRLREEDFMKAAALLFAEKGYEQTSMEDIAKAADYATGTIYRYFESKEKLYYQILLEKGRMYFGDIQQVISGTEGPLAKIEAYIRGKVHFIFENGVFMQIYLNEILSQKGGCRKPPQELENEFELLMSGLRATIEEGMSSGVLLKQDLDLTVTMLTRVVHEVSLDAIEKNDAVYNEAYVIDYLLNFIKSGLICE